MTDFVPLQRNESSLGETLELTETPGITVFNYVNLSPTYYKMKLRVQVINTDY